MNRGKTAGLMVLYLVCSCLSVAWLFSLSACGSNKQEKQGQPLPEVTTVKPTIKSITEYLDFTGNAQASSVVELQARVPGFLTEVNFKDGDWVNEGDILFKIEPESYQARLRLAEGSVAAAEAELTRANLEYSRQLNLAKQKAAALSEVEKWKAQSDASKAALLQAQASLDLAKIQYSYTQVRAPFNGRVDRKLKDLGNLVGVGEPTLLTTIYRMAPMYGYFSINEKDLVRVRKQGNNSSEKAVVYAAIEGEEGYPHKGYLDFGSSALDSSTGTLLLRGIFSNPPLGQMPKILPGMFMRLRVPVGDKPDAVMVPDEAVGVDQGGRFVLAVNADGTVDKKVVKGGTLIEGMLVIEEGLTGDEAVIIRGMQKARPGAKVKPVSEVNDTVENK